MTGQNRKTTRSGSDRCVVDCAYKHWAFLQLGNSLLPIHYTSMRNKCLLIKSR